MELDVTHMIEDADDMIELSGSAMEHGQDAGRITWNNSIEYGREHPLLKTDDERDEAREYFKGFGAWSEDEIAAWSEDELQAITCQYVAGDIREAQDYLDNLEEYERLCERGTLSGCLYPSGERWYFYLGS